jgi:DNA-binding NarL/FixJ family response regulator
MRVLLVGMPDERARLRAEVDQTSLTIAGEFATFSAARASRIEADAILIADRSVIQALRLEQPLFDEPLTPRESEILELLAEGLSNKGIAGRLGISDQTVKFHVASICGKLGAANRTDAVRRALRRGLIAL